MELSDVGLTEVGDVELFVLHDMSDRALEILQDEGAVFDDNGDDPDGPSWYCELGDLSPEVVSELESARLGYRARGTAFTGYSGSDAQKHALYQSGLFGWCGYSGRGIVFVRDSMFLCMICVRSADVRYPANDPEGLKTFDCPECFTENAVIEDDTGYHCRACGKRFGEDFFDDWRDGIEPEDEDYWKKENDPIWSRWYESVSEIHKKIDALEAQIEVERHNLSDLLASEPIVD